MSLKGTKIGFAITGSHCTIDKVIPQVAKLIEAGAEVFPIFSGAVTNDTTRFGAPEKWKQAFRQLCQKEIVTTIVEAEPFGPTQQVDIMVVAPCSGNTLAKLANGITDGPVLMAVKAHLRNQKPVVLAISTNDGLSMNAKNIGLLLNCKNIYMVPFGQDNAKAKPNSLVADLSLLSDTIIEALNSKQLQPLLVTY